MITPCSIVVALQNHDGSTYINTHKGLQHIPQYVEHFDDKTLPHADVKRGHFPNRKVIIKRASVQWSG